MNKYNIGEEVYYPTNKGIEKGIIIFIESIVYPIYDYKKKEFEYPIVIFYAFSRNDQPGRRIDDFRKNDLKKYSEEVIFKTKQEIISYIEKL